MKHVSGDVVTSRFSYANPGLRALLNTGIPSRSQQQEHRTAACGEVAALLVWIRCGFQTSGLSGSSIVTWGVTPETTEKRVREPCSLQRNKEWGCQEVAM